MITERTTCSHDFIYTVTTLFAQLRLYLLNTPGAKDSRVENHGDLYHSAAQTGDKPLLPRFVDRRQAMPQCKIELFHEARYEDRQEASARPSQAFPVSESVHEAGRAGAGHNHTVTPAK
jgi:hypothetical protein